MGALPDLSGHPLCKYFLSGYLSKGEDEDNFPRDEFPSDFQRYENIFASAIQTLGLTKEALKGRPEFNFDSGDTNNLESGIAILRAVEALRLGGFHSISLVVPKGNAPAADITCEKHGQKICCEVKAITKQSSGRSELFLTDQLYEKILENISKSRRQLEATAAESQCGTTILVSVVNWFAQSIYLDQADYQGIVNRLERDRDQQSLKGIDGVLFITKMGQQFWFLNERAKCIDI